MPQKSILKYLALILGPLLFMVIQLTNPQFWFPEIGWDVFSIALLDDHLVDI
ncbi:hypothetical protein [Marivirga sp.]|uniref:hypothetical protein n=1 Tax=Marivirga sp. TaxID=2018662 RepID=UPI0025D89B90|nr:hypothetical protein [Marivirga sp.]